MPIRTIFPPRFRVIPASAKLVFKGQIHDVYQWEQIQYDGTTATFEMLKRPDTIHVIAIKDHKMVVLREQQPSFDEFYGLPGGFHDVENENELQGAQREVLEETGMTFQSWRLIEAYQPNSKIDQFAYLFLATDFVSQTHQHLDAGEKIEITLMDHKTALELAQTKPARYLPAQLLANVASIDELANLPDFAA